MREVPPPIKQELLDPPRLHSEQRNSGRSDLQPDESTAPHVNTGALHPDQHIEQQNGAGPSAPTHPSAPPAPGPPRSNASIPLRYLTYLLLIPLMALATAAFGCVSLVAGLWDKSGRQQHAIARAWARVMLRISLSPVEIIGQEKLPIHEVAVYASNHLSYFDTPVLFARLPFQFRILAKQALWKVPFIGWYLKRSGQVPIDSKSNRSAIAGLLRGVRTLHAGLPLVLFPEGARSPDGHPRTSASGSAFMAIKAQVPIVPLALVGTYELLPIHTYHLRPRPLSIIVGNPIPTTGLSTRDADALTVRLHAAIATMYYEHSDLHPPPTTR